MKTAKEKRASRRRRIRAKVRGNTDRPRLSVFKSNKHLYAQITDDDSGKTLAAVSSKDLKGENPAEEVGKAIAKRAKEESISKVVFDRSGYPYTGNVQTIAEAARKGGLEF
ncbi:MAG: 50S ribosomal protein L18 [Candidatus Paceibacterota bacterium]